MGMKKETKVRDLDIIKPGNNFLVLVKRSLDEIFTLKTYQRRPLPRRWILAPVREQTSEVRRRRGPCPHQRQLETLPSLVQRVR